MTITNGFGGGAEMSNEKNLAAALAAAMSRVGDLAPDKINTEERFAYRSADVIAARCGQALAAEGIAVLPSVVAYRPVEGATSKGYKRYEAHIDMRFVVLCAEERMVCRWSACGVDYASPDRALAKAVTLAHKQFLSKLLCVGVGGAEDDIEEISHPDPAVGAPPPPPVRTPPPQPSPTTSSAPPVRTSPPQPPPSAPSASSASPSPSPPAQWVMPADAIAWAVSVGANENEFAARNALRRLLDERFGGRLTYENRDAVFQAFYEDRMRKLEKKENEANMETNGRP